MNFLETVVQEKKVLVGKKKKRMSPGDLISRTDEQTKKNVFYDSFAQPLQDDIRIIAEIKRASPSRGTSKNAGVDLSRIISAYESGGARALSVLTERLHFNGSLDDLKLAKKLTTLPILRKDFIVDAYELYEAKAFGADAVLLISEALDSTQIDEFVATAFSIGLDVLLEVHSVASYEKIEHVKGTLTGVNSRNLETLAIDLHRAREVVRIIPRERPVIIESGIFNRSDIELFLDDGVSGFLVGSLLMNSGDPAEVLRKLIHPGHANLQPASRIPEHRS